MAVQRSAQVADDLANAGMPDWFVADYPTIADNADLTRGYVLEINSRSNGFHAVHVSCLHMARAYLERNGLIVASKSTNDLRFIWLLQTGKVKRAGAAHDTTLALYSMRDSCKLQHFVLLALQGVRYYITCRYAFANHRTRDVENVGSFLGYTDISAARADLERLTACDLGESAGAKVRKLDADARRVTFADRTQNTYMIIASTHYARAL